MDGYKSVLFIVCGIQRVQFPFNSITSSDNIFIRHYLSHVLNINNQTMGRLFLLIQARIVNPSCRTPLKRQRLEDPSLVLEVQGPLEYILT